MDLSLRDVPRNSNGVIMPKDAVFYYLRSGLHPHGTVCLLPQEYGSKSLLCRGLSFCSKADQWDKAKGRELAYRRARLAWNSCLSTEPIRRPDVSLRDTRITHGDWTHKSLFAALPTEDEVKLMKKAFPKLNHSRYYTQRDLGVVRKVKLLAGKSATARRKVK